MEIINAVWEKRNIGKIVHEVHIIESDLSNMRSVIERIAEIDSEYIVVRTPVGAINLYADLSQIGFYFVENEIMLKRGMEIPLLSPENAALNAHLSISKMDDKEFQYTTKRISEGLFATDRISLDPHFSVKDSTNRFYWWLHDERKRGMHILKLSYDNEIIGFIDLVEKGDGSWQDNLTGIFPEFQGKGYSIGFVTKVIDYLSDKYAKELLCEISSNNISSLIARMKYGYMPSSFSYVFARCSETR